jgi:hypothetical protein
MPGTEVAFEREIERLSPFWMRPKKLGSKVARFRRVNPDCPTMHHDALELPSGEIVLLTRAAVKRDFNTRGAIVIVPPLRVSFPGSRIRFHSTNAK